MKNKKLRRLIFLGIFSVLLFTIIIIAKSIGGEGSEKDNEKKKEPLRTKDYDIEVVDEDQSPINTYIAEDNYSNDSRNSPLNDYLQDKKSDKKDSINDINIDVDSFKEQKKQQKQKGLRSRKKYPNYTNKENKRKEKKKLNDIEVLAFNVMKDDDDHQATNIVKDKQRDKKNNQSIIEKKRKKVVQENIVCDVFSDDGRGFVVVRNYGNIKLKLSKDYVRNGRVILPRNYIVRGIVRYAVNSNGGGRIHIKVMTLLYNNQVIASELQAYDANTLIEGIPLSNTTILTDGKREIERSVTQHISPSLLGMSSYLAETGLSVAKKLKNKSSDKVAIPNGVTIVLK